MAEPERRRRRPAVSCSLCRKRKIRCNRETPCSNCLRSRNTDCVYEIQPPQTLHKQHGQLTQLGSIQMPRETPRFTPADRASSSSRGSTVSGHAPISSGTSSTNVSTPVSLPSIYEVDLMKSKIRQLEEQLSKTSPSTPQQSSTPTSSSNIETVTSSIGGTLHIHHETPLIIDRAQAISHKTRIVGRSHWMNGALLARDIFLIIEPYLRMEPSRVISGVQRCKSLARIIKSRRAPAWPSSSRNDLPSKDVCDSLVDCYLRTIESTYRILHVPTFRKDYEALWTSDTEPNTTFLIQLKLVLAIGATMYDDRFSMRSSAIKWVYDAQAWSSEPGFKARLTIQALQTDILLLLARETAGVGWDLVWISTGTLIRTAICMGLHRDPAYLPKMSLFTAEMRRRLWNAILEISVQTSVGSGVPPLLSLGDFDTEPPGNFDDEQLIVEGSIAKPEDEYTDITTVIAMRKTIPIRLAVAKFLNDLGTQNTYQETLRFDAELRAAYKGVRQTLQRCTSKPGPSPSQFEMRVVDFIMCRYISILHVPYFGASLRETAYAYSRKVMLEISLKIWYTSYPSSNMPGQSSIDTNALLQDDFTKLTSFGSSFFRAAAFHSCVLIIMELKAQLEEEEILGPVPLRQDLFPVLELAQDVFLRSIAAGDTNIKGYLLLRLVGAHVNALIQGVEKDRLGEVIMQAVEDATEKCQSILENMAEIDPARVEDNLNQMSLNTPSDMMGEWDMIMSDGQFNFDNTDIMSWLVNDGANQDYPL